MKNCYLFTKSEDNVIHGDVHIMLWDFSFVQRWNIVKQYRTWFKVWKPTCMDVKQMFIEGSRLGINNCPTN